MYNIYKAKLSDSDSILRLAVAYRADNHCFRQLPFDVAHVKAYVDAALQSEDTVIYIARTKGIGTIIGGYWGSATPMVFSPVKFGMDVFSFVKPEYREHGIGAHLLAEFEKWAKSKGCVAIIGGANSGINSNEGATNMYTKSGYKHLGTNLIKSIT